MVGSSSPGGNPLSAGSLSSFMAVSLPRNQSPQIKNPYEAIALAINAGMLSVGFRLIGLGEDHKIEVHSDAENPQSLPDEWNASTTYAFRYAHSQSSMEYLVKVNRLGSKAVVMGVGLGDDKTATFDVVAKDFISSSALPATPLSGETALEDALQPLQNIFISPGRLTDLGSLLRIALIQKLIPSLHKDGYEEDNTNNNTSSSRTDTAPESTTSAPRRTDDQPANRLPWPPTHDPLRDDPLDPLPARPHPLHDPNDPLRLPPRRPPVPAGDFAPPGFEDEHEILRGPRRGGGYPPGVPFGGNIGEQDLYPAGLGPHDPIRGGVGPGLGGGVRGGGGMHPTFDDPLFAGGVGGYGGGGAGNAPPGARYDPVGPGDAPMDRGRIPRGPGGGGGGGFGGGFGGGAPPNPFSGFGSGDFI
ncbi:MAG: hypothetical protein M1822_003390 [Bathelium mastoideum]|nr:MAG: hypothetical protein M1822_003390 [Bathelium mastoideum]